MTRVCVVGAGAWGTTIANLAAVRASVTLWVHGEDTLRALREARENTLYLPGVPLQGNVEVTDDLVTAWSCADAIILAVPTQKLRSMFRRLAPLLWRPGIPLLNLSKGLELETHLRVSQLLCEDLGLSNYDHYADLSGPNSLRRLPGECRQPRSSPVGRQETRRLFQERSRRHTQGIYKCRPGWIGTGRCAQNVYAIAAGLSDGWDLATVRKHH